MGDEEKLKINIEEQNKAKAAFDEAQKQIDDTGQKFSSMGDKMHAAGDKMKSVGKKMTTYMTLPILAGAGMSIKAFSDLEETLSKVDVTFGKSSASVKKWADTSIEKMGLAKQTALDATALFGDMGTGMGMNQKEAAKMGMGLTQLGADMASFKNVSIDRAQTALAGVYTGETEALKSLGVVMTETNLAEFAASKGITKKISDMTQAEKVQLRYNFVMDKTKNAQGDFARTSDSLANKTRTAKEKTKELSAELGGKLAPIYNKLLEVGTKVLDWFGKLSGKQQKWILYIGIALAVLGPLVTMIGTLATVMGFLLSPVGLIVAAVVLLAAGLVYAYFKFQAFRNIVDTVWRAIVTVVKWAWENIIKPIWDVIVWYITNILIPYYKMLWAVIQVVWNAIVSVIKWAWENVIKPIWDLIYWYVTTVLIPVWTKIWEVAVWVWNKVVEGIQAAWNFIKPIWDSIWAFITEKLVPAFQKIWDKVSDVFTKVWNTISGWVTNVKDGFDKVKGWIATLVEKFNEIKDKVGEAFGNVADAITKPFKSAFNTVIDLWNKSIGKISIDLPDWLGGKKFSMPKLDKLYKGTRNWGGGPAIVGDVNGRGGEIVNLPGGTDVFSNRESKQILRNLAAGQSIAGPTNTFTGNIVLGDASAVKEFFKKLDRDADKASMGVPV